MPHVLDRPGSHESDEVAVRAVATQTAGEVRRAHLRARDGRLRHRGQVVHLAVRLVHRCAHACHHRRAVLRRSGPGPRLQRQDAWRVRKLRPGPQRRRPAAASPPRRPCSTPCSHPSPMPTRTASASPPALPQTLAQAQRQIDCIAGIMPRGMPATSSAEDVPCGVGSRPARRRSPSPIW